MLTLKILNNRMSTENVINFPKYMRKYFGLRETKTKPLAKNKIILKPYFKNKMLFDSVLYVIF